MPELPEVEHVVRALRRSVSGSTIIASEVTLPKIILPLAPAEFSRKLKGRRINAVNRRGKYILIELDSGLVLAVHLRMTGQFLVLKTEDDLPRHAHAVFYLEDERRLVFRDQRQFGVIRLATRAALAGLKGIVKLAPEPFSEHFSVAYLRATLARSQRTLKTLLLDQTRVLGLGNIYAAEALFRAGINPFKVASRLSSRRVERLHQAIRDVLRAAVSGNSSSRISLENAAVFSYGEAFGKVWQVYEREGKPCFKCGARIRRMAHGGRSTYWCPTCQRR